MKKPRKFKCDKCGDIVKERPKLWHKKKICRNCWKKYKYKLEGYRE